MQRIAVFCGSKPGKNPLYMEETRELGAILASHGIQLVYGGGNRGIMGAIANGILDNGGTATGIIPVFLTDREHMHHHLTEEIIVDDMHTRKRMIYEKCDAAIVLPGGFGTMDEFFEMLTWNQLSIHNKKIFLLNTAGFYDALILHMKNMEAEGFLYEKTEERITILSSPKDMNKYL